MNNEIILDGTKHVSIDLEMSKKINNYIQVLYEHPNESILICNEKTLELLKNRLQNEHSESKFKFYHRQDNGENKIYCYYCQDNYLKSSANFIDFIINKLYEHPNKWFEINYPNVENKNKIMFQRIFQRLQNEHYDTVRKFQSKIIKDDNNVNYYSICYLSEFYSIIK